MLTSVTCATEDVPRHETNVTPCHRFIELCAYGLIAFIYIQCVAFRPLVITPESGYDDGLYMKLAWQIASGHWLGAYDGLTLAKGPGFPIFLAMNYMIGLPFGLSICLLYIAAAWYCCCVLRNIILSRFARLILFAALLFVPPLASSATVFVERDFFYASLSLALFAALIDMTASRGFAARRWWTAILAGLLAGWIWITREEGIWLIPGVATLATLSLAQSPRGDAVQVAKRWALAVSIGFVVVCAVGLVNRIAYGRFELAEIKSGPFQSAMTALQRAAAADPRAFVPVPATAREHIYEQSPSFKSLQPLLDPPGSLNGWEQESCSVMPKTCGDIGGGFFMWALRSAAADVGMHASPTLADKFYTALAREVNDACREHRLDCALWMLPLIPSITRAQLRDLPDRLWRAAARVAMMTEPDTSWIKGGPPPDLDRRFVELLGVTPYGPGRIVAIAGRVRPSATSTFAVVPGEAAHIVALTPPTAETPRFFLVVGCSHEPCTITFGKVGQPDVVLPTAVTDPMDPISIGGGAVDIVDVQTTGYTVRTRLSVALNGSLPDLARLYSVAIGLGVVCFAALCLSCLWRRSLSFGFGVTLALGIAVATRIVLIALVDATSFPAISDSYLAPAFPLCIVAALLAMATVATAMRDRFRRAPRDATRPTVLDARR